MAASYNITDPTQWATAQLEYMGMPVTASNIQFLVSWAAMEGGNWENTAYYNPLNTTLNMPGDSSMNSVGVKAYTSWQQGVQATADTIQGGYPEIVAALQSGNAWQADQSGALAGDLSKWSGGGYSSIAPSSTYGGTQGGPTGSVTGTSAVSPAGVDQPQGASDTQPPPPPLTDPAALQQYIATYYPEYAWLLTVPQVVGIVEQAVEQQLNTQQIQALIQGSPWWKTTSDAMRQYEETQAENPAELSFTVPGSQAAQVLAQVEAEAGTVGVQLTLQQAQTIALDYMRFGWSAQQLQAAIGSQASNADAGGILAQLQSMAGNYYQNPSKAALQSWVQNIAAGTQNMQQFQAQMQHDAELQWTGYAPQLQQGNNMVQLTDSLRSNVAQLMEVDPTSVNFVSNPMYSKILDYVPPNSPNGVHRVMTQSETDQYLRSTPQWSTTQNARDSGASLEQAITQAFGKVGT